MRSLWREIRAIAQTWWLLVPGGALGAIAIVELVKDAHRTPWFWATLGLAFLLVATSIRLKNVVGEKERLVAERQQRHQPEVSDHHQAAMQQVLSSFQQALRQPLELGLGDNENEAFAAHFPDLVPLRDEWDAAVARATAAPTGVDQWLQRACRALAEADDQCDGDTILAALTQTAASTEYGRAGYVLNANAWMTFPQDDTIKLIQRDARSVQREVAVLPAEPVETARERCNAVIASINDIFVRVQQTSEWAEVGRALAARDALVQSTIARIMLHLGAPLFVTAGCPFCDTQVQHRTGRK